MNGWEVLNSLGIFSGIGAFVFFLARSLFTHILSKDTERFKANLQLESQREIESLKSMLALTSFEHQIRFSRMHEKRASIIEEAYANLVELHTAASYFVQLYQSSTDEQKDQHIKSLTNAESKFRHHFGKHRIYFTDDISEVITQLIMKLSQATGILEDFTYKKVITVSFEQVLDQWEKGINILEKEVPPIKVALEQSVRELLGVIEPKKIVDASASKD